MDLFPSRDIRKGTLTVMTLTQRTENDMSEFTEAVDKEREDMTVQVRNYHVLFARFICGRDKKNFLSISSLNTFEV